MGNIKLGYLLILILLSGCSSIGLFNEKNEHMNAEPVAELTDYQLNDGFITIRAVGYGCTFFDSFKVEVADESDNSLEVVRTRPDQCRMKPRNVSLQYSYKHLGLDLNRNILVKNPISLATSNELVVK